MSKAAPQRAGSISHHTYAGPGAYEGQYRHDRSTRLPPPLVIIDWSESPRLARGHTPGPLSDPGRVAAESGAGLGPPESHPAGAAVRSRATMIVEADMRMAPTAAIQGHTGPGQCPGGKGGWPGAHVVARRPGQTLDDLPVAGLREA